MMYGMDPNSCRWPSMHTKIFSQGDRIEWIKWLHLHLQTLNNDNRHEHNLTISHNNCFLIVYKGFEHFQVQEVWPAINIRTLCLVSSRFCLLKQAKDGKKPTRVRWNEKPPKTFAGLSTGLPRGKLQWGGLWDITCCHHEVFRANSYTRKKTTGMKFNVQNYGQNFISNKK